MYYCAKYNTRFARHAGRNQHDIGVVQRFAQFIGTVMSGHDGARIDV
jgi:hypothetical protein